MSETFKVPESPCVSSRCSQRLSSSSSSPSTNPRRYIFKSPERVCKVSLSRVSEDSRSVSQDRDEGSTEEPPSSSTPPPTRTPSPSHQMTTRSGRTPAKELPPGGAAASGPSDSLEMSVTTMKLRSDVGTPRRNQRSRSREDLPSCLKLTSAEDTDQVLLSDSTEAEPSRTSEPDSSDSSQMFSGSTEDDSLDIVDAAVVKTQFTGGLKINISFSRKSSQGGENIPSSGACPKPCAMGPGRSYGFRQTPDRQQRKAAARLGYGNQSPRFSTPRGSSRPRGTIETGASPLTYQVEMEMQTSGVPKLKIKRADSMSAADTAVGASEVKPSQLESPVALFSKHREPGCVSPSLCGHATPAKTTPGKGVQTYICQSYTPTRAPAGTVSPVATADTIPLTPSPQSVGRSAPDHLNSWPRRKRAQEGGAGGRERGQKGEPLLAELLEEAELGVSRLQDAEEADNRTSCVRWPRSPLEDFYWMDTLSQHAAPQTAEEEWMPASGAGDIASCESDIMSTSVVALK